MRDSTLTICLDNEQIYKLCQDRLGITNPKYEDVNAVIADHLSSVTSSMRFGGSINKSLNDMAIELCPFPRIHFLQPSKALHVPVDYQEEAPTVS